MPPYLNRLSDAESRRSTTTRASAGGRATRGWPRATSPRCTASNST